MKSNDISKNKIQNEYELQRINPISSKPNPESVFGYRRVGKISNLRQID